MFERFYSISNDLKVLNWSANSSKTFNQNFIWGLQKIKINDWISFFFYFKKLSFITVFKKGARSGNLKKKGKYDKWKWSRRGDINGRIIEELLKQNIKKNDLCTKIRIKSKESPSKKNKGS